MSTTIEGNLVGGRFMSEAAGDLIELRNAANVDLVGRIPAMGVSDVEAVRRKLAESGIRVVTEMVGKNAAVVLADADLDMVVPVVMAGAFGQADQRCTATSRLIVDRAIAAELRERVADAVPALRVAAGEEDGTDVGRVVSRAAQRDIGHLVETGLSEGVEVIGRASLAEGQAARGSFVEPVFLSIDHSNTLWREEVFGPVLGMDVVDGFDEAVEAVNDSAYGLSSAVYTQSLDAAFRFVDAVDTGQVSVNLPTSGWDIHKPFGGFKQSGSAFNEQGLDALHFYMRVKTIAQRTH